MRHLPRAGSRDGTEGYFRPLRRLHAGLGILFVALWVIRGPGPRGEEGFGVLAMVVLLSVVALSAAALSPSPWFNALLYPGLFATGFAITAYHVAFLHGDPFDPQWLGWALLSFVAGGAISCALNRWSASIWRKWVV